MEVRGRLHNLIVLLSLFSIIFVGSCSGEGKDDDASGSGSRADSIAAANKELTEFIDALAYSIDTISSQEGAFINLVNPETGTVSTKDQIYKELDFLQRLIKEQKEKIAELEKAVSQSQSANAEKLQKIIRSYQAQLEEKEMRIASLEEQLRQKNADISQLTDNVRSLQGSVREQQTVIQNQNETLAQQTEMLNEAYVIVGTKKELQQMGVLTSSGLFKKAKLDLANIRAENFNKVDIRYFTELPISGKKPKILSQVPGGSYILEETGKNEYMLKITNPKDFWSISNFLIIQQ